MVAFFMVPPCCVLGRRGAWWYAQLDRMKYCLS